MTAYFQQLSLILMAIMPNIAIPCEVKVGKTIYVVKDEKMKNSIVTCDIDTE